MSNAQLWHRIQQKEDSRLEARAKQDGHDGCVRLALRWSTDGDKLHLYVDGNKTKTAYEAHAPNVPPGEVEQEAQEDVERQYSLMPWIARTYNVGIDILKADGWQSYDIVAASGAEALAMFNEGDPGVVFDSEEIETKGASDPYINGSDPYSEEAQE